MTDLPASRVALTLAALLLAGSAAAQVGPPIRLGPPGGQQAPLSAAPSPAGPTPATPFPLPPNAAAAPESGDAVFGSEQWDGSSRVIALSLLRRLPGSIASPTLHDIARRMLLAPATPAGEGSAATLLSLRLDKLASLGDSAALAAVLAQVPAADQQARLTLLWLADKRDEACALTKQQIARTPTPELQQSQIACAALAGERDTAELGLQILREQQSEDATLAALVEMASGSAGAALPRQPSFSAVTLGLARGLKGGLPADVLRSSDGAVLRAVAESQATQPLLRLAAAERAAIAGSLTPAELATFYRQVEASPAERGAALATARSDDSPRARALLWLALQSETAPGQRIELLRAALDSAAKSGSFAVAARLYEPQLTSIVPSYDLARMALPVGQALYLTGATAPARAWYQLLRQSPAGDGGAAAMRLWALGRLAEGDAFAPLESDALLGWYEMQKRREPGAAAGRLGLLYALVEGLGDGIPGPAWEPLLPAAGGKPVLPSATIDPALSAQLRSAAESARVAEAASLVLVAIGSRLPGPDATLAAYDALVALRFIGLDREARALAIEIALAAGL